MSDKKILREQIEKDIECAQAKLAEFKAQLHTGASGGRAENAARLDVLRQRIEEAKFRLLESNRPPESVQEQLVDGVEDAWSALQDGLQDAISTFEGHH